MIVTIEELEALDADAWAQLLPHLRTVLDELGDDEIGERGARIRGMPSSRLAGGTGRRELCRIVCEIPVIRRTVRSRLQEVPGLGPELASLATDDGTAPTVARGTREVGSSTESGPGTDEDRSPRSQRERRRSREIREERDAALRRADGEQARAERLERELVATRDRMLELEETVGGLRSELDDARRDASRSVERERRRHASRVEDLESTLHELRRSLEEQARQHRRESERRSTSRSRTDARAKPTGRATGERDLPVAAEVVPGRPTRLPADVAGWSTEAAELLLGSGRRVIVDGYNVTLQHRPGRELEHQRTWLVGLARAVVARRNVHAVIVFDGQRGGGVRRPHPGGGRIAGHDVDVRFTESPITADDEIVLAVEATDEPVVVVTDDRELRARVQAADADVIGTTQFVTLAR